MRVVVFGATGTIGTALVPVLARDHDVDRRLAPRARQRGRRDLGARRRDRRRRRCAPRSPARTWRTTSSTRSARPTSSDATASRPRRSPPRPRPPGLRQIVYLGGLGDDAPDLSPHLRSRIETGLALASGSTPVTTLRAAMVVGAGSAAFETILALVDRLPAMVCPRWVSTPTQPIALDDVVAYLAAVVRPGGLLRRGLRRRRPGRHDLPAR